MVHTSAPPYKRQLLRRPISPLVLSTGPTAARRAIEYQFPTSICNWLRKAMKRKNRVTPRADLKGSATSFDYLLHYDEVKCTISLRTDPVSFFLLIIFSILSNVTYIPQPDNRPRLYAPPVDWDWNPFVEETKFFLRLQVELPSTAGFSNIFRMSPTVVLATFQGSRDEVGAPDWLDLASVERVFWQQRTLMLEVLSTSARLEFNAAVRDEIYDWTRCVSVSFLYFLSCAYS